MSEKHGSSILRICIMWIQKDVLWPECMVRRSDVEMRVTKLKNGKEGGKVEVTGHSRKN